MGPRPAGPARKNHSLRTPTGSCCRACRGGVQWVGGWVGVVEVGGSKEGLGDWGLGRLVQREKFKVVGQPLGLHLLLQGLQLV